MAAAESEQNLRVPGTLTFQAPARAGAPARRHGRCGERTKPQGAWHPEVRGAMPRTRDIASADMRDAVDLDEHVLVRELGDDHRRRVRALAEEVRVALAEPAVAHAEELGQEHPLAGVPDELHRVGEGGARLVQALVDALQAELGLRPERRYRAPL